MDSRARGSKSSLELHHRGRIHPQVLNDRVDAKNTESPKPSAPVLPPELVSKWEPGSNFIKIKEFNREESQVSFRKPNVENFEDPKQKILPIRPVPPVPIASQRSTKLPALPPRPQLIRADRQFKQISLQKFHFQPVPTFPLTYRK